MYFEQAGVEKGTVARYGKYHPVGDSARARWRTQRFLALGLPAALPSDFLEEDLRKVGKCPEEELSSSLPCLLSATWAKNVASGRSTPMVMR